MNASARRRRKAPASLFALPFAFAVAFGGWPAIAASRALHGIELPEYTHVDAWDAHLRLAGARVDDHRFMPFQVVALYLGPDMPTQAQLAGGLARCRLVVHWLGPALAPDAADDWWDAVFARSVPDPLERQRIAPSLRRLADAAGAPARGVTTTIDYDPDAGLHITFADGATMRLPGLAVARAVLGVWLGPEAGGGLVPLPAAAQ